MKANEFIKQIFAPVFMTLKGAVAASFRPLFAAAEDGFVRFGTLAPTPTFWALIQIWPAGLFLMKDLMENEIVKNLFKMFLVLNVWLISQFRTVAQS